MDYFKGKVCSDCKLLKKVRYFTRKTDRPQYINSVCKVCMYIRSKKYRKNNRDKVNAYYRKYYKKHPEYQKRYYKKNRKKIQLYWSEWCRKNPEKIKGYRKKHYEKNKTK